VARGYCFGLLVGLVGVCMCMGPVPCQGRKEEGGYRQQKLDWIHVWQHRTWHGWRFVLGLIVRSRFGWPCFAGRCDWIERLVYPTD
jgi:hypothetical protein